MTNNDRSGPSIAIVGSGFSGIGLAIRLRRAGFTNLTIYEKASGVGGVWRDNTYPGAACDAPSHLYSYSFEPNPNWSRRYAEQSEILAYLSHCATKYDILQHVRTDTEVVSADYDAGDREWQLVMADGNTAHAAILVTACGQLSQPSYPDLPGLETFAGKVFHSARWDHEHDFHDRDVVVIGNGASAIQFVPHIAERARSLTIIQRQSHWISPKPDREYSGLRKRINRMFPAVQKSSRLGIFLIFETMLNPLLISPVGRKILAWPIRVWCRSNLRTIADPELRRALEPTYEVGCNRILTSNEYFETLNRDNTSVALSPIVRVEPDAVVTEDGRSHRADTVIFATGFRSHDFVAPIRITGRSSRKLTDVWQERPRAYLGLSVPGFPNFFLMYGPNTNVGSGSIVHMLESQMNYIVGAVRELDRCDSLEIHPAAVEDFDRATQHRLETTVWNTGGCNSWYIAKTANGPANTNNWPGSMLGYRRRTRRFDPDMYYTTSPGHD